MEIKCGKCGGVLTAVIPETYMDGEIKFTFFRRPDCGVVYPVAVTDSALRKDITGYHWMRETICMKPVTEKFIRNAEILK